MTREIRKALYLEDDSSDEQLINLTPLIDVLFVILIIFILITPDVNIERVQLALSSSAGLEEVLSNSSISIVVQADNTVWIEKNCVTLEKLAEWLKEKKQKNSQSIPRLVHDSRAQFGTYQTVKNIVETCGFTTLEVVLKAE